MAENQMHGCHSIAAGEAVVVELTPAVQNCSVVVGWVWVWAYFVEQGSHSTPSKMMNEQQ
jgi:hypothetical protein